MRKVLLVLVLLLLPVVACAEETQKPEAVEPACVERPMLLARSSYDKQCLNDCGTDLGVCHGNCDSEDCMSSCDRAYGRCTSRCQR